MEGLNAVFRLLRVDLHCDPSPGAAISVHLAVAARGKVRHRSRFWPFARAGTGSRSVAGTVPEGEPRRGDARQPL